MPRVTYKVLLDAPLEAVWAFFEDVERGLTALTPPEAEVQITRADPPALGAELIFRAKTPVGRRRWQARYVEYQPPTGVAPNRSAWFADEQVSGPFARWRHEHRFQETLDEGRSKVWATDTVDYKPPLGPLGLLADRLFVRRMVNRLFEHRHNVMRERLSRR